MAHIPPKLYQFPIQEFIFPAESDNPGLIKGMLERLLKGRDGV